MPSNDAYEIVAHELGKNEIDPAMWAKAIAETGANENRAKARYIELRAQRIEELAQDAFTEAVAHKVEQSLNTVGDKTKEGLSTMWLVISILIAVFLGFMAIGKFFFD